MSFSFRPFGLAAIFLIAACTTTMVSDRSEKGDWLQPEYAGIVNKVRDPVRAPAGVKPEWANVPGYIDPSSPDLTTLPPGVKIDTLEKLAKAFNMSISKLLDFN